MNMPNRINVALSRAMDRLVIFGASRLWDMPRHKESPLGLVLSYILERTNDDQHYQYIADQKLAPTKNSNSLKFKYKTSSNRGGNHE